MTKGGKRLESEHVHTHKAKSHPHFGRIFRYAYRTLVVLAAIIVGVYVIHAFAVPEPEMRPVEPPIASNTPSGGASSGTPTDDPNTAVDESKQTPEPVAQWVRRDRCYNFLLVASDQGNGNTDTIMVVQYDVPAQTVHIVSVPRDTLVDRTVNGHTYYKINAAYYNGSRNGGGHDGGIRELTNAVTDLLGIPIDRYVKVDIRAFVRLVNAVGGIDFNVPVNMNYDDPTQNLHIHYTKGWHYGLTGQQVLEIARCRSNSDGDPNVNYGVYPAYPDSDIGRTRTQQQLLTAIAKKMLTSWDLGKIKEYITIFNENVKTDLTVQEMIWFAERVVLDGFDISTGISTATLAGDGSGYYKGASVYILYPDKVLETVNALLNPYTRDLSAEQLNVFQK